MRAAYNALTKRPGLVAILEPAPPPGAPVPSSRQALSTSVDKIVEYDKYIRVYQGISAQPSIGDIAALMSYALDVQLPPNFTINYGLYEHALSSAHMRPIRTADVQPTIEQIVQDRSDAAIRDAYTDSQLFALVRKLASLAGSLTAAQGSTVATSTRNLLAETQITLDRLSDLLVGPSYDWLSGKPGSTSPLLSLEQLKGLQVVRADFIDGLLASAVKAEMDHETGCFTLRRLMALPCSAPATTSSRSHRQWMPSRRLLNDLFSQPFMQPLPAAIAECELPPCPEYGSLGTYQPSAHAENLAESFLGCPKRGGGPARVQFSSRCGRSPAPRPPHTLACW